MISLIDLWERLFRGTPCCVGEAGTVVRTGWPVSAGSLSFRRSEVRRVSACGARTRRAKTRVEEHAPCTGLHFYGMSLTK